MDVNLDRILIPVILCIVGISVHNSKSSTSLLVFFAINTIIFSILVGSRKSSLAEIGMASPLLPSFFEVGGNIEDESVDKVDEITTQEQEESDDNLKSRIESFITKVYKGWIEESYWDKYGIDM
ncbi:hypothetical protein GmHk_05G012474 [Glycine max]|uniref:Uncharacterized protein n=3 Tax=Glycine subgen. Soja TaxID=1462606 RepID=I1K0I7_SOYBN|nr:hypothetical protein JHK85_012199 [Glycine max]KAH1132927.1 hypothetical protein GYH30_011661 [Glycine max]KAH1249008.1 hypothetical protein GmHk_05G012474 [Glycine max]KHN04312.1 hypothetical protein glysoja_030906 [Glycine soja]